MNASSNQAIDINGYKYVIVGWNNGGTFAMFEIYNISELKRIRYTISNGTSTFEQTSWDNFVSNIAINNNTITSVVPNTPGGRFIVRMNEDPLSYL